MFKRIMLATAVTVGLSAAPAAAQQQNGLVNVVLLEDVEVNLERVISDNQINVQAPINANVQVPIGIAANVCDVAVNVLAKQAKSGGATCNATNSTASESELMAVARSLQGK
jgi:hypothetical protein